MQAWAQRLSAIGRVQLFDYDYAREGKKRPDLLPQLIAAHRRALAAARQNNEPVILIGKSMGGRVGCHVALEEVVNGVVCLGYPLCAGGDRSKLRDKVLRELQTPVLFVQGTRDPLCPLDLLQSVRAGMAAANLLHAVEGGDHSLLVRKKDLSAREETQESVDAEILQVIASFVGDTCRATVPYETGYKRTNNPQES